MTTERVVDDEPAREPTQERAGADQAAGEAHGDDHQTEAGEQVLSDRCAAAGDELDPDTAGCEQSGDHRATDRPDATEVGERDELETLARNEAPGLGADTVQPKAEPDDGEQRFLAFRCRGAAPTARPATDAAGAAETYPIED